ncbi:hypothetical protein PBI_HOWE_35 [Gordonia phage Howe]|uniref:Uncharacterized protein n=1 Tax=Gordonia phage Howe TaxID=1777061 RepID=A0A0U4J7P6_9CAUD|nr:hypothetical protein PP513_gp35 [Gordonia phage Howe]ALY07669.1 hypothetical protein PBI_HOWE_35 [Gordonia phage Howe]QDF16815.1 hypothetical protein SEA_TWINKLE_34 [Gordonia phage Twinkle]QYC54435.1 hypothetical protein SEA_SHLIM410_34 [Gordonia phage Shlim410]UAJ16285.1 hypothetical protein SEA_HORTENSE_35 [Gordonia phage Hortense]
MNTYPDAQSVIADLGDKFLLAFVNSVTGASDDLRALGEWQPEWYVSYSQRFIANFIHERMWARTTREVSSLPDVHVIDQEPVRQLVIGNYVIRFKRHKPTLQIRTYPTAGALAFWTNRATLPGMEQHSLALGYIWDAESGQILSAIVSYRDGKDNPIWSVTVEASAEPAEDGAVQQITHAEIDPSLPQIDLSEVAEDDGNDSSAEG